MSARASWPTSFQERLLVAALASPREAASAWSGMPSEFSLDVLEPGSFELLPLVYRNLSEAGSDDVRLPRLKGIYRRSWVKNNLLLERVREIAAVFAEADLPALFLEGPTFANRYYPDLGLRPTSTIHLLVHPSDGLRAVSRLGRVGWTARAASSVYPGWRALFDDGGNICVLRTSLAFDFVDAGESIWSAADESEAGEARVHMPNPTDALLSVLVSGARLSPSPRTQWIADAAMLHRVHEIDWERLCALGAAGAQTSRLRATLGYLRGLPIAIPAEVFELLARARPSRRERLVYGLVSGAPPRLAGAAEVLAEHLVATRDESALRATAGLAGRLRERWGLKHSWQIPAAVGRRARRQKGES